LALRTSTTRVTLFDRWHLQFQHQPKDEGMRAYFAK